MPVSSKWLIAILFLAQALLVGATFRSTTVVGFVALLAVVVVLARHRRRRASLEPAVSRLPRWLRWTFTFLAIVAITVVTAAWRLANQFGEDINPVSVAIEVIAHNALFVSLLIWTLRPDRGHVSMLPLGLVVILTSVAAGGASLSLAGQTTVGLAACLGYTIASQIILGAARGKGETIFARSTSVAGKSSWLGPLFTLMTLSILMMATTAIANATNYALPTIRNKLQEQLEATLDAVSNESIISGTRYVNGSKLGSIRQHMLGDPEQIALRIGGDITPGYLRGHAFDLYGNRRWSNASPPRSRSSAASPLDDRAIAPSGPGTVSLSHAINGRLQRFPFVGGSDESIVHLEIQNDPYKGPMVFLPLTTRWIEAYSRELIVSNHGIVRLGVDPTRPYVAGVGLSPLTEQLDSQRREVLITVPPSVSAETKRVADEVCGTLAGTRSKAEAISRFFQSSFVYSMTPTETPRGVDPINHFLRSRHPAHCEYFASSTVLLLRSAKIPARYVTGYVADEFDDEESLWVARNRDAHAWAEAYDDATGQWFPVESTPGRRYHTIDVATDDSQGESIFDVFGSDDSEDSDSLLSRALGWLLSLRATDPLLLLFRLAQLPLFCVLAFLLWTRYLKPDGTQGDPIDQQSRKMLRKVDRRLRKHALVRRPSETLYQFADRIEQYRENPAGRPDAEMKDRLAEVARWYRDFSDARYQGEMPTPLAS